MFVPVVFAASFAAHSAFAVDVPGPLVDPAWLNAHLNDVKVLQSEWADEGLYHRARNERCEW